MDKQEGTRRPFQLYTYTTQKMMAVTVEAVIRAGVRGGAGPNTMLLTKITLAPRESLPCNHYTATTGAFAPRDTTTVKSCSHFFHVTYTLKYYYQY